MLFKNLLLLLTIVVPGIAQNSYTSLLIQGVRTMNADCANLLLSFKVQLRLDHRTNILDACENHTIIPQINMELNNISLCTNNNNSCSGITPTYTVPSASDIPWISLSYTFCNVTRLKTYFLWENDQFNVSTQRSNFVVSNSLGFISIRNCHAGYTLLTNFLFCIKETNDLDCNFQMSTHAPTTSATTPFPTRSTSNLPILTSTVSPFPNTSTSYFTSRNLTTMSPTTFSTTTSSVATTMPSTLHTTVRSTVTTTNSTTITSTTTTETNPTTTTNLATTDVTTIKPTSQSTSESSTYMTSTKNTATTLNTTIIASTTVTDTTTVTPTLSSTYVSTIISTNSRTSSTNTLPSSLTYPLSTPYPLSSPSTTTTTPSDSTSTKITSTTNSLPSTTLESTTPLISTSPTNNLTPSNSSPETSTLTTPQSTPFVPSQNPYDINCTNPDSDLDAIYCHVEATNYTASEISGIINNTINAVNITKLTPKEVFAVVGIFRRCSEINDLTHRAFTDMSRLVDEMLEAPSESYIQTHEVGIKTTQIILDSVNRVILNSPSDVSYLNGKNVALLGKVLNCGNNNKGDAGGLIDTGSGFDENDATTKTRASISIDGNVACAGQAHRVFYTIYRNSKFFIRTDPNQNANNYFYLNYAAAAIETTTTTQNSNKDTNQKCKPTVFGTDDSILSGTLITNNSTSAPSSASFIHSVAKEGINQNIVNIKFDKKHIGVFLHGKLGIRWWDIASNSWSSESCKVEEKDGFYISKCTHLTDFTLLVDGIQTDPILCNRVLEIVNYIVSIGSMFSLLILNVIYIIILIPPLSQKIFSNLFLKIVPKSDKNIASFIYSFLLFLFFFIFTLFTNQDQVVIKTGCYIVAALNYWLLMTCIILSLFQSWKIVKMFVWNSKLERIFHLMTMKKIIYPIAFTFSSLMTILFGIFTQGDFFKRNDSFCWIRPDYLIAAVIIPLTILSINAILTIFIMSLRLFPHFTISKLIRTSSTKINKISNKEARERAFVLFLVQFTLGVPWLLQYFTLFEPKATAFHFLFVVVNGSQGIIILISFIYRCYGTYKSYNLQKRLWT